MKFVSLTGVLQKARRYVSAGGAVQEEEVKNSAKLAEIIRQLQRRVADIEAVTPPEPLEFEVNVGIGGAITTIAHGLRSAVRWYVVQWTQVGGAAVPISAPQLVQDSSSTSTVLALRSYVAGKAIVRVETAFADVDGGITVAAATDPCPKFAALTTNQTNVGAGAYVNLFSTTVDTRLATSKLVIQFSSSYVKGIAAGVVFFIILVDGVATGDGTYNTVDAIGGAGNCVLQVSAAVTAGNHTVTVQWAGAPNNVLCRPATFANEFASMFLQEIP